MLLELGELGGVSRVYRCTFRGSFSNGALAMPSVHYQTDLPDLGSEPDPADVAQGVWNLLGTAFLACCHTSYTVTSVDAVEEVLKPDVAAGGSYPIVAGGGMLSGTAGLSHAQAAVIDLHTETRSRSARGWLKMPSPLVNTNLSGDTWHSGYVALLQSFAALLDNSFDIGDPPFNTHVNPMVYSRTRRKRAEEPWVFRVKTATVNPQARWQRSRLSVP